MAQLEHIEAIEKRLWGAADTLRANSNYAGNEYFLPVMGLIFLRHAYSRYLNVKDEIVASLPTRGGKTRTLTKEDFSQKSAQFVERLHQNPSDKLTFRGLEKNATTIRLAKMNLAVHGLEGDIQKAITYYEDPHELLGKADFVMANPPFNVEEDFDFEDVLRDIHVELNDLNSEAVTLAAQIARNFEELGI